MIAHQEHFYISIQLSSTGADHLDIALMNAPPRLAQLMHGSKGAFIIYMMGAQSWRSPIYFYSCGGESLFVVG